MNSSRKARYSPVSSNWSPRKDRANSDNVTRLRSGSAARRLFSSKITTERSAFMLFVCKRSPRRLQQGRSGKTGAVCSYRVDKEMEGIASLPDTRSFNGQQPSGEEFSVFGLIAIADLSPLDCRTYCPLCCVVGWLNPFVFEKGEQPMPVLEQAFCRLGHVEVGIGAVHLEASAHSTSYGHRFLDESLPVQVPVLERMPQGEHSACLGKHPLGESIRERLCHRIEPRDHNGISVLNDSQTVLSVGCRRQSELEIVRIVLIGYLAL
jgi:hypothetical protein